MEGALPCGRASSGAAAGTKTPSLFEVRTLPCPHVRMGRQVLFAGPKLTGRRQSRCPKVGQNTQNWPSRPPPPSKLGHRRVRIDRKVPFFSGSLNFA